MKPFVYALVDPLDKKSFRYIGMTFVNPQRPYQHAIAAQKSNKKSRYLMNWIRQLQSAGRVYEIVILEEFEETVLIEEVLEAEVHYIKAARDQGHQLTNLTDGGEGVAGVVWSEESKQRAREAGLKRFENSEHIARHIAGQKRRYENPIERALVGERKRGQFVSEETRKKQSLARVGRKPMLGKHHSEETKQKMWDAWTRRKGG